MPVIRTEAKRLADAGEDESAEAVFCELKTWATEQAQHSGGKAEVIMSEFIEDQVKKLAELDAEESGMKVEPTGVNRRKLKEQKEKHAEKRAKLFKPIARLDKADKAYLESGRIEAAHDKKLMAKRNEAARKDDDGFVEKAIGEGEAVANEAKNEGGGVWGGTRSGI